MRKKKIRILAILLAMVCMAGGCGKADRQGTKPNAAENSPEGRIVQNSGSEREEQKAENPDKQKMEGEITISTFLENELLNAAAKAFMKKYPKVTVTVHEYAENIAEPSEKDYQTMFNTKLMGRDAEDIIMNSFLPVARYSEMGAFEDLSKYISQTPEWNEKDYFMNVIKAAEQENGEVYILPYMARFDVLDFDDALVKEQTDVKEVIEGMESVRFSDGVNLAKQMIENTKKKNAYLSMQSPVQFTTWLVKDRLSEFLDMKKKKAKINTAGYKELLNSVKKMKEAGYFDTDGINFYNTECYIAGVVDYDMQAAFLASCSGQENGYSAMPLADSEGNVLLNSNYCLMLNSASRHKALAWEFIKYLLSEQIQSLPSVHGVPINRKGFARAVKRDYDKGKEENPGAGSLESYQKILEGWMEQINACNTLDSSLIELLEEENEKFFEGKQTVEETARRLQGKMEQYFNE